MPEINKEKGKFYIVDEGILPEAILKTARIKELLAKYKDMTVNDAVEEVGLSRSAFYKYRDGVFPFYEATKAKIITLQISMDNKAGILSNCINTIARRCTRFISTVASNLPRSLPAEQAAELASAHCADTAACNNVSEAISLALKSLQKGEILLICGSVYVAGEARRLLATQ